MREEKAEALQEIQKRSLDVMRNLSKSFFSEIFLALREDECIEIRCINPETRAVKTFFFSSVQELLQFLESYWKGKYPELFNYNVYFGIHPRRKGLKKAASAKDVTRANNWLVLDIDYEDGKIPDFEEVSSYLPFEPRFAVFTGQKGYQCWFKLAESPSLQEWTEWQEALIKFCKNLGLPADEKIKDHARVLRVPFTWHPKGRKLSRVFEPWSEKDIFTVPPSPLTRKDLEILLPRPRKKEKEEERREGEASKEYLESLLRRIIEKLRKEGRIAYEGKTERGPYWLCRCPLHPPDRNPSLLISGSTYLVTEFHDKSDIDPCFKEIMTLKEFAQRIGVLPSEKTLRFYFENGRYVVNSPKNGIYIEKVKIVREGEKEAKIRLKKPLSNLYISHLSVFNIPQSEEERYLITFRTCPDKIIYFSGGYLYHTLNYFRL